MTGMPGGASSDRPRPTSRTCSRTCSRRIIHVPRHPLRLALFGLPRRPPRSLLARSWKTPQARALFGGVAAHAFAPLSRPMPSSVGCALIDACHAFGWPVASGGSRCITDALASVLRGQGGKIETGRRVTALAELDDADLIVLDLAPAAVAEIAGERLPARVARSYRRYRHGPGAFKIDLAVEGGVPWTNEACRRAGTVHVAGTFEEIAIAERAINRGSMPERPFLLVGQQYLADPNRSKGDLHPVWVYAHVPSGYAGDATGSVFGQVERFAPGFRERIVASAAPGPPISPPTTPTTSEATSSPERTHRSRSCSGCASRSTRIAPESTASTSAPRPRHPARAPTA